MYKIPNKPVLPKLVNLSQDDESKAENSIYKLDWKPKEQQMKIYFNLRKKSILPKLDEKYNKTELFPVKYLDWLYNLRFEISDDYLKEIAYQSKCGQEEWSRTFPNNYNCHMDTVMREHCLTPSISHFNVAFSLLADCLYDIDKKKNDRELYWFAKVAMLIYFWDGQTGSGLLLYDDFSGGYNELNNIYPNDEFIQNFIKLINNRFNKSKKIN